MQFVVDGAAREIELEAVIVAGYTGRDRAAVMHHIDELAAIGVKPPERVPMYWQFPPWLAMQTPTMVVSGRHTSGEAEVVLIVDGSDVFVALGSDHTDRAAESIDIALSKGVCPKMLSAEAWRADAVADRWGELVLRSFIDEGHGETPYQDGRCDSLTPPLELLAGLPFERPARFAMLTGTVPVIGDLRPAQAFRAELVDPARDRALTLSYRIRCLD